MVYLFTIIINMPKTGRNEKCPCNSNKKYSKCCLIKQQLEKQAFENKFTEGHPILSENVRICVDYLEETYTDHKIIDITDYLNSENYRTFQIKNYTNKTIMVAEKTDNNANAFIGRGPNNDFIIMYRGSYRTFKFDSMLDVIDSIDKMIKTRFANKDDK